MFCRGTALSVGLSMLLLISIVAARPCQAAESAASPKLFEVTPLVGFAFGGSFSLNPDAAGGPPGDADVASRGSFGLALDLRADDSTQFELFYTHESTELNTPTPTRLTIQYLHIGGTATIDDEAFIKPYVAGGLGATFFTPSAPGDLTTRFSASVGLGLRVPVNSHFSVRVEARGFVTLVKSDTATFCSSGQSGLLCQIHGRGSTFLQGQVLAGAAFSF